MTRCTRCHRHVRAPVDGLGPKCAKLVKRDPLSSDLFTGIDLAGAEIAARTLVGLVIDAAVARELSAMRAGWRAPA